MPLVDTGLVVFCALQRAEVMVLVPLGSRRVASVPPVHPTMSGGFIVMLIVQPDVKILGETVHFALLGRQVPESA